jgi:hypothetical protein
MTILAIVTGLIAAALLLSAGYLFGVRRGRESRERLRYEAQRLSDYVRQMSEQSSQRAAEQEGLKTTIQEALAPLVQRERLSLDLAQFNTNAGRRRDLTPLLDKIAAIGNFTTVMLTNEEGLPLAASRASRDLDRLAAAATRLALVADQIGGENSHAPLSILLRDASDATTLCRIFHINDGPRLTLTAVSNDPRLTSVVLDPALPKIEMALSSTPS